MAATTTPGAPCWIELFTDDADGARRFYGGLFGWEAAEPSPEFGGYFMFVHDGAPIAGCMTHDGSETSGWGVYLYTADAAATIAAATAAGGKVDVDAMPVGDAGTMAWLADPTGAGVGLWQPADHPGIVAWRKPGAPAWFELLTDDYETAVDFYRTALGWDAHVMSEDAPRYTTLGEGEAAQAGIQDAREELAGGPSRWQFFVQVADTDAAVAKALELGGSVDTPAEDTEYGRLAELRDPQGLPVRLMGPNRS